MAVRAQRRVIRIVRVGPAQLELHRPRAVDRLQRPAACHHREKGTTMAQTTVPLSSPSGQPSPSQPTRRSLLAGVASTPVLALPAVAAAADPHLAWHAEWRELHRWCDTAELGGRELRDFPQWDRCMELERLIALTPARTLAGARVQLALLHHVLEEVGLFNDDDVTGLASAIATLERLAGSERHG
jgi:hypothetical protein